ncbi:MAG: extracellular solute-binding protein [Lachnospiraceae bacterium]|nr:extracellular solute-binding protein [Lachnospiraceae bacterium]
MKNKTLKRVFAVLLACVMLMSALTGCGNDPSNTTEPETKNNEGTEAPETEGTEDSAESAFDPRSITEGVKLTIAAPEDTLIADYNTNKTTLMIEEALGVDLEFITFPSADYASKLNVMVMGGDELPDIIFKPGSGYTNWVAEDVLVDLTEYYENPDYSANIRAGSERATGDSEYVQKYMTLADGKVYGIPNWQQDPGSEVQQKIWVYEPWLEALNMEVPQTTEDFYNYCKAVAETDLNGNGKNDEIGLVCRSIGNWFDFLMTPYVYAHESLWRIVEDGQVSFAYTTDEWKEGLKYIRSFFADGLMPSETLTQSSDQYKALLFAEECVAGAFPGWCFSGSDAYRRNEYTYIVALEGPSGQKLSQYAPVLPKANSGAVITTDCENPAAAFLVCDYMCSEVISLTSRYGEQGVDWDFWEDAVNSKKLANPEDFGTQLSSDGEPKFVCYDGTGFWYATEPQNVCYRQIGPIIRDQETVISNALLWKTSTDEEAVKLDNESITWNSIMEAQDYLPEEIFDYAPMTIEESEKIADIAATMKTYLNETISAFLSGDKDIDAEWDAYLAELDKIGMNTLLEVYQAAYDRVH